MVCLEILRELEPDPPRVSHHVAGHDDPAGPPSSVDHDETLVHVPVHVLAAADPGPVPSLGAVVIVLGMTGCKIYR